MNALSPSPLVRSARSSLALLSLALLLALGGCASETGGAADASLDPADVAPWNQARVTALAEELVLAADEVQNQLRNQAQPSLASHAAAFYRLTQSVRRARREARHFASALQAGKGQPETLPIFEGLDELIDDAAGDSRKILMQDPLMDAIIRAGDVANRIRPYYDPRSYARP